MDSNTWRPVRETEKPANIVRASGANAAARLMAVSAAGVVDRSRPAQRRRAANGLALATDPNAKLSRRIFGNRYFWAVTVLSLIYVVLLFFVYRTVGDGIIQEIEAVTQQAGVPVEITWPQVNEAYLKVTALAVRTVLVWIVFYILIDRLRPTTWSMKWIAFGWGSAAAIFVSLHVNTWAGSLMLTEGPVDASQGSRAAIYSAPFVEEAAKLTILFWLAILLRRRIVAAHQAVVLAGLSAVGFAFVENIVYYIRTYMYASNLSGEDANAALNELFVVRGIYTSFGHPTFTSLAALGFIVGLTNRSKLVRVVAPLAGYCAAALGHMLFNGFSSVGLSTLVLIIAGWIVAGALFIYLGFRYVHQIRNIRARLNDFVVMGWLDPQDPRVYSHIFGRMKMVIVGFFTSWRIGRATIRLQRNITELAYLRDAEVRGLVDEIAVERQRDLILAIETDRLWAITDYRNLRWIPQSWRDFFTGLGAKLRRHKKAKKTRGVPPQYLPPVPNQPHQLVTANR